MNGDGLEQAAQTAAEHAAAAAAAAGGAARTRASRPAALAPDTPEGVCANCATRLQGPVCHQCGQVADVYHRPITGLIADVFDGLLALDGRVVRTLPALLLRPGRITRAFLKGRRARYLPPFRLYIIASLIFFLLIPGIDTVVDAVENAGRGGDPAERAAAMEEVEAELQAQLDSGNLTAREADQVRAVMAMAGLQPRQPGASGREAVTDPTRAPPYAAAGDPVEAGPSQEAEFVVSGGDSLSGLNLDGRNDPEAIRRFFVPEAFGEPAPDSALPLPVRRYLADRFAEVAADPGGWVEAAIDWVPRIMFVMVPIYALLLALTYSWRRGYFLFDHLIVSLHLHAALFLVMAILMLASNLIGAGTGWLIVIVYSNLYLYRLHRVVYARGRITSVLRTVTLDALYFVVLLFGFIAVLLLGALA